MAKPPRAARPPRLIRFLALHFAIGAGAGMIVIAGVLVLDVGHIRALLAWDTAAPFALLGLVLVSIFGCLGVASAVAMLPHGPDDEDDDHPGPRGPDVRRLQPITLPIRPPPRPPGSRRA